MRAWLRYDINGSLSSSFHHQRFYRYRGCTLKIWMCSSTFFFSWPRAFGCCCFRKEILEFTECFSCRVIKESKSLKRRKIVPTADQGDLAATICTIRDDLCSLKSLGLSVPQFPIYKKMGLQCSKSEML